MDISIIVAIGEHNEIGRNNGLLCHLPADLRRFKELTVGHTIVMGRKTFESLPKGALPNRRNVVLTRRSKDFSFNNCIVYSSLSEVIDNENNSNEIFIIGGAEVFRQALPLANKLYLTKIHAEFNDADTFFPEINYSEWKEVSREEHKADDKHLYDYTFLSLQLCRRGNQFI